VLRGKLRPRFEIVKLRRGGCGVPPRSRKGAQRSIARRGGDRTTVRRKHKTVHVGLPGVPKLAKEGQLKMAALRAMVAKNTNSPIVRAGKDCVAARRKADETDVVLHERV